MDAEQRRPKERALLQIKGTSGFLAKNILGFCLLLMMAKMAKINETHANRLSGRNDLHRLPITEIKRSSERLMPLHNNIEGPFQRRDVEVPLEGDRRCQVVYRTARLELVEEPQSLLGKGKRRRSTVPATGNLIGGCGNNSLLAQHRLDQRSLFRRDQKCVAADAAHDDCPLPLKPVVCASKVSACSSDTCENCSNNSATRSIRMRSGASLKIAAASTPTAGFSKTSRNGKSIPSDSRTLEATCVAIREWPPISKKSSSRPTRSMPSTLEKIPASTCSSAVRGATNSCSGSGFDDSIAASALRSILPVVVSGKDSSTTNELGTM